MISTITLDTYKQQIGSGDAFNLSDSFNGRVGDEQVPLVVQFKERGLAQQFQDGLVPFLTGFVGSLDENDQVTAETGEAVSYVGTSDDIVGLGRVKMSLPGTMFPQEGYFYGFLGLQNADGKRVTTFNIWFHVYNGNPDMFVNKAPFRTELQKVIDAFNDLLASSKGTFNTSMNDWKQQVTALLTDLNGDYAKVQTTVNLIQQQLTTLEGQIKQDGLLTDADIEPLKQNVANVVAANTSIKADVQTLNSRSFIVNDTTDILDHMSLVANLPQLGTDKFPQFMQIDNKTGLVYLGYQNDTAASQTIVELDKTGKKLRSRDLGITGIVWLEGCSLYHDATTGHICFIVPADLSGNWFLYDYDADTKSEEFHIQGSAIYCIDDSGQYFVTEQERYDLTSSISGQTIGFNIYSLSSVLAKKPVLTTFVPVKESYVRGNSKIQGVQMIDGNLYLGRGVPSGWFRTTVINQFGAVLSDYNWNKTDLYSLLGLKNGLWVESEGISCIKLNQQILPALSILSKDDNGYHYGIVAAGDPNGTVIGSTAGATMAAITRFNAGENGLDFVTTKDGPSILDQLLTVRQQKSYTFTVDEGNVGLAPEMASSTGIAIVRDMDANCKVIRMTVIANDYNNSTWTIYYDNGVWSRWSNKIGIVPLWEGYSNLSQAVSFDKPVSDYKRVAVIYITDHANSGIVFGDSSGVIINTVNTSDTAAASAEIYEAQLSFPTNTSAILTRNTGIMVTATGSDKTNGPAQATLSNGGVSVTKIMGVN
ncbi:hypothetical protein [Lactiplantibacillus plantarum]|uniref:hypothetical protein n=1 Tax=Lactiplantibacillus plantarum TaxID=1590 RepID=UPI001650E405|nr:hypothetical protein [Lactiplantibacillus plantarum]